MGKYVITSGSQGETFRFRLVAGNGQTILTSETYKSKAGCENGIKSVQNNSQLDTAYERMTSRNGKYYFNLKARNGEIIGNSELYESESGRENGIDSVRRNGSTEVVETE
ncbi:YegP family protein [Larkinella soli]|uniref:YegP family protein n=1 Tax=Larkinella soli TaxID=1770527 RepID=UPI000FFBEFA3|nr:YegP family protein [Larkinella soli]